MAAAGHQGLGTTKQHWKKADLAHELAVVYGLPEISDLLRTMNNARKAAAYGDVEMPELDAEQVAFQIEAYVKTVAKLIAGED